MTSNTTQALKLPLKLSDFKPVGDCKMVHVNDPSLYLHQDMRMVKDARGHWDYQPSPYFYHLYSNREHGYSFSYEEALEKLNECLKKWQEKN